MLVCKLEFLFAVMGEKLSRERLHVAASNSGAGEEWPSVTETRACAADIRWCICSSAGPTYALAVYQPICRLYILVYTDRMFPSVPSRPRPSPPTPIQIPIWMVEEEAAAGTPVTIRIIIQMLILVVTVL